VWGLFVLARGTRRGGGGGGSGGGGGGGGGEERGQLDCSPLQKRERTGSQTEYVHVLFVRKLRITDV